MEKATEPVRETAITTKTTGATLISRISSLETGAAVLAAGALAVLVALEPDIVRAPFASTRAVVFTVGGTVLAAVVLFVLLRLRVPPAARLVVLGAPFLAVNWWLLSPYFIDEVVDDRFDVSIAAAPRAASSVPTTPPAVPAVTAVPAPTTALAPPPASPVLLGAGRFAGLAGHEGTGDAGLFRNTDGAHVVRFENFDIQNGPDLRVYLVPGAGRTTIATGSVGLGKLRGNVGDQTYALPAAFAPGPGPWTALVWCEAFGVEFVAATIDLA